MAIISILNQQAGNDSPLETNFDVPTDFPGSQLLAVSGSAFSFAPNGGPMTLQVKVQAKLVGTLSRYADNSEEHLVFATQFFPVKLSGAERTLTISPGPDTTFNESDWFSVALIG